MINILGDSYGAGIVYHLSKKELEEQDRIREAELAELREKEGLEMEEGMGDGLRDRLRDGLRDGKVDFKGKVM